MKSGFVALAGRPNVGKSSLVNAFLGRKVAIVSDKPQTTRNRIVAALHGEGWQMVLLDTPGIHRPRHLLGEKLVRTATGTLSGVDLLWHVVDLSQAPGKGEDAVVRHFPAGGRVLLVGNKRDLVPEEEAGGRLLSYAALYPYAGALPVSALSGKGLGDLREISLGFLPEGPAYYPEDTVTDQPETFVVAELIREKILHLTRDEIPHAVAVTVEEMEERGELLYVRAVINVERESQKGIIIGQGGLRLREIGSLARSDLEAVLGTRVYLDLWVKVKKDWRNREGFLREMGLGDG